jgi:hypothetical protein
MSKHTDAEREEAAKELRKLIKPKQRVYCLLRSRASSGMSRVIDLFIVVPDYETVYPTKPEGGKDYDNGKQKLVGHRLRSIGYTAAKAMDDRWDSDKQGIRIGGCGMDMGFALVYDLGQTLWPNGTRKPHGTRNGEPDRAGGYALKHEWL